MISTATVTRCTPRQDGQYLVQARLDAEGRLIVVISPAPVAEGQRLRLTGSGALWHLAQVRA